MSLIRRAGTVGGLTLLSRLFGFVRDIAVAAMLGAGPLADAFMVAFRLPNHFRAIFAEGAFNSAFVPTYAAIAESDGDAGAREFRSAILNWSLAANALLLAIALVATGWLIMLLAPGLQDDPSQQNLAIALTRITFPYLACLSVVTLMSGVLNAHDRFAAAAAAPILLNLAMTVALVASGLFASAAHAAAWGVLAGGIAQLGLLAIACQRARLNFHLALPSFNRQVLIFLRRFWPAVLGSAGIQIAMFADTIIATFLPTGSLSYLYYADRLYQLPLAVIGIAVGTALLPDLSRRLADPGDLSTPATLGHAVAVTVVLGLPCALLLCLLGDLVIEVLFARGAFDAVAVAGAAGALGAYAIGLPAAIALRALVSGFHARGDTATPVKALMMATIANVALKLALVSDLAHVGLALATAAGAWLYAVLLAISLYRRNAISMSIADRVRLIAALTGCVGGAIVIVVSRGPVEAMFSRSPQVVATEFTLIILSVLSLFAITAPAAAAELWARKHR